MWTGYRRRRASVCIAVLWLDSRGQRRLVRLKLKKKKKKKKKKKGGRGESEGRIGARGRTACS